MCDCYGHKCQNKKCNVIIDMHLSDYDTGRDEIEVYCGSHIPSKIKRKKGILWKVKEGKSHTRIFVKCLTKNAKKNWEGNSYNGNCVEIEAFGVEVDSDSN